MAFKRPPVDDTQRIEKNNLTEAKEVLENKFISQARGETAATHTIREKPKLKAMNIPLPIETIERIKRYQMTEARKIETQTYIFNEAVNMWLDSKGFK